MEMNPKNTKNANQQKKYNVGDIVEFYTREIAMHASVMAGTATSIYLNDYPLEKAKGTISSIHNMAPDLLWYAIIEERGFFCSVVFPEDILDCNES